LGAVATDRDGRVVYVDLLTKMTMETGGEEFGLMRLRLFTCIPTNSELLRLRPINRNRVLVEVDDARARKLFLAWILQMVKAESTATTRELSQLLAPLGDRILLLGGHFICPKVTEYEPRILQQTAHTDVANKGEAIAVGLHLHNEPMNTLLDTHATLDPNGNVQNGIGFRQANTPVFAYDTGAVHACPGVSHVHGPYPRFLANRIFFLLCSAQLTPAQIAKHRSDNGLAGRTNLVLDLPPTAPST